MGHARSSIVLTAFCWAVLGAAANAHPARPSAVPVVSVPMIQERGVLYLQAKIDGAGPFLLVFDPGAEDVYATSVRDRLAGRSPRRVCIAVACFPAKMKYFDGDGSELNPQYDARAGAIAGSIGPSLLDHYVATIDYRASTIALTDPVAFRPSRDARRLALTFDDYGLPVVRGAVDGADAPFELDVRAPTSMLFRPYLVRTGLDRIYAATPVVKQSAFSIAHAVRSVRIGQSDLHDIPFWFSTATSGKFADDALAGLLGNNVLSHFVLTLDLPDRSAYLAP